MKTAIQSSIRIVLFNLVPVLMIIGIVNALDIEAAIYYVSTSGNNANSCATAQGAGASAKRTVAGGLACLSSGDTLRIQAGLYTTADDVINTFRNPFPGGPDAAHPTTIECEAALACTLRSGGQYPHLLSNTSNVTIRQFVLDGNNTAIQILEVSGDGCTSYPSRCNNVTIDSNELKNAGCNALKMTYSGSNPRLTNNLIHDNSVHDASFPLCTPSGGGPWGYGCYCDMDGALIEGNTWYNNGGATIQNYPGKGSGSTYRNNTFHDNGISACASDLLMYGPNHQIYNNVFYNSPGGGIRVEGSGHQIYNNTFYNEGNCDVQTAIWVRAGTSSNTIKNNLILNVTNAIMNAGSNSTISSNSYNNTPNTIINLGSGNIIANNGLSGTASSIFTDVSAGDFTLKAGSTPIDAGETISFIKTDRSGMPRPYGSSYDIGAYEFQGTSLTSIAPPSNLRVVP